jgi:flagellar motor protein MotB
MDLMLANGVPVERIMFAGRGTYDPEVNNRSSLGRLINRRIEVILFPDLEQFETLLREHAE